MKKVVFVIFVLFSVSSFLSSEIELESTLQDKRFLTMTFPYYTIELNGKEDTKHESGRIVFDYNNKVIRIYVGGSKNIPFQTGPLYYQQFDLITNNGYFIDCTTNDGKRHEVIFMLGTGYASFTLRINDNSLVRFHCNNSFTE